MSDPAPAGNVIDYLSGLGMTTFAALVYMELRDLRRLVGRVLLSQFPAARKVSADDDDKQLGG